MANVTILYLWGFYHSYTNWFSDYSAAFVTLTTDSDITAYGTTFANGRGTDIGKNNKKEYSCIKYLFPSNTASQFMCCLKSIMHMRKQIRNDMFYVQHSLVSLLSAFSTKPQIIHVHMSP